MLSEALQRNAKHEARVQTSQLIAVALDSDDPRLKAWPRPGRFRGCVAASLRSE
jgi:hypothetical protein